MQADNVGNNVLNGESRQRVSHLLEPGAVRRHRGTYGYYSVRSNAVAPRRASSPKATSARRTSACSSQDAWTINNKLTINLGVRTERERVPTYPTDADVPEFGLEFGFGDKLAPRVGFAYDIKGDGKWKAFGSWGIFYDIFKLELPRGSFGGDKWLDVLLHARHLQLDHAGRQHRTARRRAPARSFRSRPTSVTRRSARTPSSRI